MRWLVLVKHHWGNFGIMSWESWESLGVPRTSLGRPLGSSGRPWRPWERPGIVLGAPGVILELLGDPCLRPVRANCWYFIGFKKVFETCRFWCLFLQVENSWKTWKTQELQKCIWHYYTNENRWIRCRVLTKNMKIQVGLRETLEFKKAYKTIVILRIHKNRRKKETTENSQQDDSAPKSSGKTIEI